MSLTKFLQNGSKQSPQKLAKRICVLRSKDSEYNDIDLPDGKIEIGRSRSTGIKDTFCSKKQVELVVNLDKFKIDMKVLGVNPIGLNGFMVDEGTSCELKHGDLIELVYGRFAYEVVFDPPPPADVILKKESEKESSSKAQWDSVENGKLVMYTSEGVKASNKIAAYDLDGTIIKTKSGNVFPKDTHDWEIIYPEVREKLKRLFDDGFKICFFTNQAGIAKGKVKLDDFKSKIKAILNRLKVPVQVFIAVGDGYYRKPVPGMWNHLTEHMNNGIEIRKDKSFYVGDAAGRPEAGSGTLKRRRDHSSADRLFASNVGIQFYTPEEHFLSKKCNEWNPPEFDPTKVENKPLYDPPKTKVPSDGPELIVLVGLPGSGKSHFARKTLEPLGYKILNADTLGSVQACVNACEKHLQSGVSCAIDNTNVDVESRKKFVSLANKYKLSCRCFVMATTAGQIKHNIAFRQLTDKKHSKINDMILNSMKKRFKTPEANEGFSEVVRVNLVCKFDNPKDEELYRMYLVEK